MKTILSALMALLYIFSATALGATDTKSKELIDKLISEYNEQMKNIRDLTLIREKSIHYQKWDRESEYRFRTEEENGKKYIIVYNGEDYAIVDFQNGDIMTRQKMDLNPDIFYEYLRSIEPEYAGVEKQNGHSCHILELKNVDLKKMRDPRTGRELLSSFDNDGIKGLDIEKAVADVRLYLDGDKWVIRKIEIDVQNIMYKGRLRNIRKILEYKKFRKKEACLSLSIRSTAIRLI
jgi:outer membrane lipoprotein-sorting protein